MYLVPSLSISWYPPAVFAVGIALILVGGTIRQYAVWTLDRYFTNKILTQSDQTIIETGPYRWVRHPSYTGAIITFVGISVILANWASIGVMVLCIGCAYGYRINVEEQALREQFEDEYRAYTNRTPYRIFPYVW